MGKRQKLVVLLVSVLCLSCLVIAATVNANAINHQLRDWKLLPEPERLSELYFTNHATLPNTYTPDSPQTIAFTVHNLEYKTINYTYVINENGQANSAELPLVSGSFSLKQNDIINITKAVNLIDLGPDAKVTVQLKGTNNSINYLVQKVGV